MRDFAQLRKFESPRKFWSQHREVSLNWLALGLLLAAWNAAENDTDEERGRPETLRGYSCISVRAATRVGVATDRWMLCPRPLSERNFLSKGHKSVNVL
jgi:hypothetical protein